MSNDGAQQAVENSPEGDVLHGPGSAHGVARTDDADEVADVLPFPTVQRPAADAPKPLLRSLIGEVLRDERHRQGRTLADVADAASVSLPYLSEVERGRKEISSDLLDSIGDSLGLDLGDVLDQCRDRLRAERGSGIQLRAA